MGTGFEVLLVSGSLRDGSSNTSVLRTVAAVAPPETSVTLFDGLGFLPHFNPDDDADPLPPAAAELRAAIAAADAVVFCTPEYAGALPGSFKNLLDWTVGGMEIHGKAVAWVNASPRPGGAAGAHQELRTVLGYVEAGLVEDACAQVNVAHADRDGEGTYPDPVIRTQLTEVLTTLRNHVQQTTPSAG